MLKELREKHGLTFEQLSAKIGYSKGYLCEVETGKKVPSHNLAKAFEKFYGGEVTRYDLRPDIFGTNPNIQPNDAPTS